MSEVRGKSWFTRPITNNMTRKETAGIPSFIVGSSKGNKNDANEKHTINIAGRKLEII